MRGSESQYKSAVKSERKSQMAYDNRMTKKPSFKGGFLNSIEKYQKDKMQKVAISNCSKEDYQKNVSKFFVENRNFCQQIEIFVNKSKFLSEIKIFVKNSFFFENPTFLKNPNFCKNQNFRQKSKF